VIAAADIAMSATPAVPTISAAPAVAATPSIAAPVKAGATPAGIVPAIVLATEKELCLLHIAQWRQSR
jgi:hypothetical protein